MMDQGIARRFDIRKDEKGISYCCYPWWLWPKTTSDRARAGSGFQGSIHIIFICPSIIRHPTSKHPPVHNRPQSPTVHSPCHPWLVFPLPNSNLEAGQPPPLDSLVWLGRFFRAPPKRLSSRCERRQPNSRSTPPHASLPALSPSCPSVKPKKKGTAASFDFRPQSVDRSRESLAPRTEP